MTYYDSLAPTQLPLSEVAHDTTQGKAPFTPLAVSLQASTIGLFTLLRQHPITGDIYLVDGMHVLYQLDEAARIKHAVVLSEAVSDIHFGSDSTLYLLTMGNLNPHDEPLGSLLSMNHQGDLTPLIRELYRPVHLNVHDLDQDGREDIIICEFGNHIGQLSWYRKTKDDTFEKHVLWKGPGAVKTYVRDFNQDGKPDVVALLAQGQEGVYIFYQQDDGRFDAQPLLQFPPVFGSSDFLLADIDQDGDEDIVVANGDNADLSNVLKPYHGVYGYRNDGSNQFSKAYFYPMHGATRVLSGDFDQDGDIDVAASAFFPDFEADNPLSFVYLENTTADSLAFIPRTLSGLNAGRWLLMETMYRGNEKTPSIMLGSFNLGLTNELEKEVSRWNTANVNLMILVGR